MCDLESSLLASLREIATHKAALGLTDDAAVLDWPLGSQLVATHDMLAEGVHFTAACPPADIGWKLAAVNLSDLAAMGARPVAVLMGAGIASGRDSAWASELLCGLAQALDRFAVALIGGDTIRTGAASVLSLTALGQVTAGTAMTRSGAQPGDDLWVSGTVGEAGLGLQVALGQRPHDAALLKRYRRPTPRLALGNALRGVATAAVDISDGLLLDAARMARASGTSASIEAVRVPCRGDVLDAVVFGDDYELLFAASPDVAARVEAIAVAVRTPVQRIGKMLASGPSVILLDSNDIDITPERLGWHHV